MTSNVLILRDGMTVSDLRRALATLPDNLVLGAPELVTAPEYRATFSPGGGCAECGQVGFHKMSCDSRGLENRAAANHLLRERAEHD